MSGKTLLDYLEIFCQLNWGHPQWDLWDYYKNFISQTDPVTDNTVAFNNLCEVIGEKLIKLSPKAKKVFYLSRFEGKSIKEIASKLGLTEKAVEYHIGRSLKELKIYLKGYILLVLLFHPSLLGITH